MGVVFTRKMTDDIESFMKQQGFLNEKKEPETPEDYLIKIRAPDCDICGKTDAIQLPRSEIFAYTKTTDMGVGGYPIMHHDHTRILYFDIKGNFLGDTVALQEAQKELPKEISEETMTVVRLRKTRETKNYDVFELEFQSKDLPYGQLFVPKGINAFRIEVVE